MAIGTSEPVAEYVSNADASSYTHSSSYTPAANSIQVIFVTATACTLASPTISGGSGWSTAPTLITSATFNSGVSTLYCFVGRAGASPGSFTCTFDCTGDAATGCMMAFVAFTGAASSSYTVQTKVKNSTTGTNPSITFDANLNTNNGYAFACANPANPAGITETGSWTESVDTGHTSPTTGLFVQHRAGGESGATVTTTRAGSINHGIIGIEIAVESSSSPGSSTGSSTAAGVGASVAVAPGASAGVATVSGVGASVANSVGASDGIATAAAVGAGTAESVGASSGVGAASGVGTSTAESAGASSGGGGASGASAANSEAVGSSAGVATVSGVGDYTSTAGSVGASAGTAAASGVGASTSEAVGASAGAAVATAVGSSEGGDTEDTHDGITPEEARALRKLLEKRRQPKPAPEPEPEPLEAEPEPSPVPVVPASPPPLVNAGEYLALLSRLELIQLGLDTIALQRALEARAQLEAALREHAAQQAQEAAMAVLALIAAHEQDEDDEEDLMLLMSL